MSSGIMILKREPHEHRFAYGLWGILWWLVGVYDAVFLDNWMYKYFASLFTAIVFMIWIVYEYAYVRFRDIKKTLLYFTALAAGTGMWNAGWLVFTWMFYSWRITDPVWLAPNIEMPLPLYLVFVAATVIAYLGYGILMNIRKDIVEVEYRK